MTQSTVDAPATAFDRTTDVTYTGVPGLYGVELSPEWSSLVGIHGGSMVAIAVKAIEHRVPDRRVRTLATTFSRTGQPGPAHLHVEVTHASRSITSAVATLSQGDRHLITTRATLVAEREGVEWSTAQPLVDVPLAACVPIEPRVPTSHFEQADGLLDPSSLPFTAGPRAAVRGYMRPKEPRPVDAAWLAMAADWFPPPAFVRVDPPTGGISIDLVTHIHRTLPSLGDEWLAGSFENDTSTAGLAVEHGRIATRDGVLLAESFHTRWTAEP